MRRIGFDAGFLVLAAMFLCFSICFAGDEKHNPHSDTGDCATCHVASSEKLRGWFVFGATKKEMKADLNQICQRCHKVQPNHADGLAVVGTGHAIGRKPAVNHENLPLASDGTITCAITCHNMHVTSDDRHQQLKHLRLPVNSLCVSCHDK